MNKNSYSILAKKRIEIMLTGSTSKEWTRLEVWVVSELTSESKNGGIECYV